MAIGYGARTMGWSTKAVIALGLLAVLLVAAVPAALVVGLILMLFGHIVVGLALFGASILAAVGAVAIATLSGVRHLRKMLSRSGFRTVQLRRDDYDYDYNDGSSTPVQGYVER
jgi:hypothetical protein